jgi:hypothetical protein
MFDQEPEGRWLMYHPESECVFEVLHPGQYQEYLDNQCVDVTGDEKYEALFKSQA